MDRDRLDKIKHLAQGLATLPGGQRKQWLKQKCGADRDLYKHVVRLFRSSKKEATVPGQTPQEVPIPPAAKDYAGQILGQWRLVKEIGHGGMGSVWLAERADAEFKMLAAVKMIRAEHANEEHVARFRRERQILADLKHPNIAMLLDGGNTPEGLPYLVMEYVNGTNIVRFCHNNQADTRTRVKHFRDICEAVAHAHQKGILHRDIKPSNTMVSEEGVAKLLDFGIAGFDSAKGTEGDLTRGGASPMTPDYASPERLQGCKATEADDIYALGLVLFYMLTGRSPKSVGGNWEVFLRATLAKSPHDEMLDGCVELLTRVLGKPQWRPATADALVAELEEVWTMHLGLPEPAGSFADLELTLAEEEGEDTETKTAVSTRLETKEKQSPDEFGDLKKIMAEAGQLWKFGVAELALEKLIEADQLFPGNLQVLRRLKMVYLGLGRTPQAVKTMLSLVQMALESENFQDATDQIAELQLHDRTAAGMASLSLEAAANGAGLNETPTPQGFELDFGVTGTVEDDIKGLDLNMDYPTDVLDMREVLNYETHTSLMGGPTFSSEWSLDWRLGAEAPEGNQTEPLPDQDIREIDQFIKEGSYDLAKGLIEAMRGHFGDHHQLRELETRLP